MKTSTRPGHRGATILETLIASVIIIFGLTAALAALLAAATESRLAQNRQSKMMLLDAAMQRFHLMNKLQLIQSLPITPITANPRPLAVGVAPWVADPSPINDPSPTNIDFSNGAYFNIAPDGTICRPRATVVGNCPASAAVPAGTPCDSAAVPIGTFCREVVVSRGAPPGVPTPIVLPTGSQAMSVWVRVSRRTTPNQPPEVDVQMMEVIIQ
jgi:type II secretory pathway pseudopilin PulG